MVEQIPRKIKVGLKWYSVEIVEALLDKGEMGKVIYPEQKIKIGAKNNRTGRPYGEAQMKETFWHELVHAILVDMGEFKLNKREDFVEEFAKRLAKAIKSARY
jgi:hypothetical protein